MSLTFEEKLGNFADLAVRAGAGVQSGQRLMVRAPIEAAELVRLMARSAYEAGSPLMEVIWVDDAVKRARYVHAPRDSFDLAESSAGDALNAAAERGDAFLSILATDPNLLGDQDPALIARAQKAQQLYLRPYYERVLTNGVNWSVISTAIPSWADSVFPDAPAEKRMGLLWDAIFTTCRADQADPVGAWRAHRQELSRRSGYLTDKQYTAFEYEGPGTKLTVGMPQGHTWQGGGSRTDGGIEFIANMPTEEVFSLPHRERTDGHVRSTKPLSYAGKLIKNFTFAFESGRVTSVNAEVGEDVLNTLVNTDEGAARLGEIALVPHSSAVSQLGVLFNNTLFDENAASHLAVGKAYRNCLSGGTKMSDDDFRAGGGNDSLTHVDFMIGSAEMNIDGVTADGTREPVMRDGEWAFEVGGGK